MAIRDEIITALVEGLAALQRRVNDVEALRSIPGPQGERGEAGPPPSEDEIRQAAIRWLEANITQPADGKDGADGRDGAQGPQGERGPAPTSEEIALAVETWMEINRASLRGPAGQDGRDGSIGDTGPRGADGARGPIGPAGPAGPAGVGIALVEQRTPETFWITLTDGQEFEIKLPEPLKGGGSFANIYNIDAYFNSLSFNLNPTLKTGPGVMQWNSDFQTLTVGINDGSITHHMGMELYYRVKADSPITKGQVVMFTGSIGASGILRGAPATGLTIPERVMGIASQNIATNDFGFVQWFGEVRGLRTDGSQYGETWVDGDILWLDPDVPGGLTKTLPPAPAIHITMCAVVRASAGNSGILFVRPTIRSSIAALSDVTISSPLNGQVLTYDSALGVWKNAAGGGGGGSGTVTSVAISAPTGFAVTGSPVTTTGTLALSFTAGYALPTIADVANGVTAYGWGNHALAGYALTSSLASVATSGAYADLSGRPTLAVVATTGAYTDLTGRPTFAAVATSGAYADLSGKPSIPDSTSDLTNDSGFITAAAIPTNVSSFTNDAGYAVASSLAAVATSGTYADLTGKPSLAAVATSGAYADLTGSPTLATVATTGAYTDLTGRPALAAVATSGAYADLSGRPTIPTTTSQLTNDSGFIGTGSVIDGGTF